MSSEAIRTTDVADSTASPDPAVPRHGRRTTGVLVGTALATALAVGWFVGVHADRAPASSRATGATVQAAAGGGLTYRQQVPAWRPSPSAPVSGGSLGATTREQVPPWRPSAGTAPSQLGQTYREQVPRG